MNAKEFAAKIADKDTCHMLEQWIEHTLLQRANSSEDFVTVRSGEVAVRGWKEDAFVKHMARLGFHVKHIWEDRPCGQDYYLISWEHVYDE